MNSRNKPREGSPSKEEREMGWAEACISKKA